MPSLAQWDALSFPGNHDFHPQRHLLLPFLLRSRRCRTWCMCMFAFPPHTPHVSLRSLSTISDLILTYGSMTRSLMTGSLRRFSDNPPNGATRGFFFSRWIIYCRHVLAASGVCIVAC